MSCISCSKHKRPQNAMHSEDACPFCKNCMKYKGISIIHEDGLCAMAATILCRLCNHRGHLTSQCTAAWPQWERPTSLEELIAPDIRHRYGIISHTPIAFGTERGAEGTERELAAINEIVIPDDYTQLKEFIERHKIKVEKVTKESLTNCRKAVKNWAISRGHRVVMKYEIAHA